MTIEGTMFLGSLDWVFSWVVVFCRIAVYIVNTSGKARLSKYYQKKDINGRDLVRTLHLLFCVFSPCAWELRGGGVC
jgi:hypothetical protein